MVDLQLIIISAMGGREEAEFVLILLYWCIILPHISVSFLLHIMSKFSFGVDHVIYPLQKFNF